MSQIKMKKTYLSGIIGVLHVCSVPPVHSGNAVEFATLHVVSAILREKIGKCTPHSRDLLNC